MMTDTDFAILMFVLVAFALIAMKWLLMVLGSPEKEVLWDEIRALRGKLAHARKHADPVYTVNTRLVASLQAKLHEHRLANEGIRALLRDCWADRQDLRQKLADLVQAADAVVVGGEILPLGSLDLQDAITKARERLATPMVSAPPEIDTPK